MLLHYCRIIFTFTIKFYPMKYKIIAALALLVLIEMSSCAYHQYPGSYHQNNRGQARFY